MLEWMMLGAELIDRALDKRICGICKTEKTATISIQDIIDSIPYEMEHYMGREYLVKNILGALCSSDVLDKAFGNKSPYPNTKSEVLNSNRICKKCFDRNYSKMEEKFNREFNTI